MPYNVNGVREFSCNQSILQYFILKAMLWLVSGDDGASHYIVEIAVALIRFCNVIL